MAKKTFILVLISFSLTSCFLFTGEDEELRMKRRENTSYKLKLNGFYYSPVCDETKINCNYQVVFLNRNGTLLWAGSFQEDKFKKIDSLFIESSYLKRSQWPKFSWGVYSIKGDSIFNEEWRHGGKNYSYIKSGVILNDTTFLITNSRRSHYPDEENKDVNETYHFVRFEQKPDSTSIYIGTFITN